MSVKFRVSLAFWGMFAGALLAAGAAGAQSAQPAAGDAAAQSDPAAKPKAKPKKAALATVAVVVTNHREVALKELFAAISGAPESKKIAGPLAPSKKVVVHLPHDKACLFDLHGVFEDGVTTEAEGVALCKEKAINLVE